VVGEHSTPADQFAEVIPATLELARRGGELSVLTDDADGWKTVMDRVDRLRHPQFLIALCGEFSSGKSVLLGALLRRPELFPDGVGATTALPTVVRWGPAERVVISTLERQHGFAVDAADLAQYVTEQGNPHNTRQVVEVLVELPDPQLMDGVCFVDLPGIGSTYAPHAIVTNAYLERIDAAVFVTPSTAMSDSEVEFLGRVAERVGDSLVIALSKADLIGGQYGASGLAVAVADLRKKAAAKLAVMPDGLEVIPVSALNHQTALGDVEDEQASGIPDLAAAIEKSISARAGSLLAADALAALGKAFEEGADYGRERLKALTTGRTPEIIAILDDRAVRNAWLTDIADREPAWTQKLRERLAVIGRDVFHELNGRLHTIRTDAATVLKSDDLDANAFTSGVVNKVHDQYVASARSLEGKVNEALADLAGELKLKLDRVSGDTTFRGTAVSAFVEPVPARRITGGVKRFGEAANRAARKSSGWRALAIGAGLVVGAVLTVATGGVAAGGVAAAYSMATGAAIGAATGAAVGIAAPVAMNVGEELAQLDNIDPAVRRQRLQQHVVDALTPNLSEATGRISTLTTSLLEASTGLLKTALAQERALVKTRVEQLNEDLEQSKTQAVAEADALRPQLGMLDKELVPEVARLERLVEAEMRRLSEWQKADTGS